VKCKVVIAVNAAWNLVNFRSGLIRALVARGFEVVAVAPDDGYADRLDALGCRFVALPMDNQGTHPLRDAVLLWRFYRLLRHERPDVFLGYTVKPNIYGSLAAHALRIPVVNNIAGLGSVFISTSWVTPLVKGLYRLAFFHSARVFFQNTEDRQQFLESGIVKRDLTDLVPGSGVDLDWFAAGDSGRPVDARGVRFLLIARMLWDKGVGEFVDAQMDQWVREGVVSYLGSTDDVRPLIADADCVVLPSYREGTPRALLEAAAMGKPLITTDAVGCRDVVDDGLNGYLCHPRDAADLASRMERMIALSAEQRAAMGRRGREKMEREFDERIVIGKYLDTLQWLTARPGPSSAPMTV
jgi:glycosyltransferase involved in cell wall biosynthesis